MMKKHTEGSWMPSLKRLNVYIEASCYIEKVFCRMRIYCYLCGAFGGYPK